MSEIKKYYVVVAKIRGLNYYLRYNGEDSASWQGLVDNATVFDDLEYWKKVERDLSVFLYKYEYEVKEVDIDSFRNISVE